MKTGDAAKRLGVSNKTILNWTDRFQKFMSDGAKPGVGLQRDFNTADLHVLNTVLVESTHGTPWEKIDSLLNAGTRYTDLPPENSVLEGESALAVTQKMAAIIAERDQLTLELQRERAENAELHSEVIRLNREMAVLEYRLKEKDTDAAD